MNVNKQKQSTCIACRLAKCISVGMSPEYVRKSNKSNKTQAPTTHDFNENPSRMTFHSPTSSMSTTIDLTSHEWKSISNIIHAYDAFSVIPQIRDTLRTSDQQNLRNTLDPMKMTEQMFSSTQLFIRSIPDFHILTTNEQDSLLQRNLKILAAINSTYINRESTLSSNEQHHRTLIFMLGDDVARRKERLENQLDRDSILVKLMLIVVTFSSNLFALDPSETFQHDSFCLGTFRLFGSQNIYVQLLWKYLMHRYSFSEAVIRFSQLIKQILDTILLMSEIGDNSQQNKDFVNSAFQNNRENFLHQQYFDNVPIWGYETTMNQQ